MRQITLANQQVAGWSAEECAEYGALLAGVNLGEWHTPTLEELIALSATQRRALATPSPARSSLACARCCGRPLTNISCAGSFPGVNGRRRRHEGSQMFKFLQSVFGMGGVKTWFAIVLYVVFELVKQVKPEYAPLMDQLITLVVYPLGVVGLGHKIDKVV